MPTYECLMPHCRTDVYRRHDVCEPCWADRRGQLSALPELYVMCHAMLTPGSRIDEITNIQLNKPESGVPFSLVIFDTLEHAYDRVTAWDRWLRGRQGRRYGYADLYYGTTGHRFAVAVADLKANDTKLATTDFAGDYVLDIFTVYRRLAVQCLPTAPRHLNVTCPVCDHATVITRHADAYAACLTCATEWPHSQLSLISKKVAA